MKLMKVKYVSGANNVWVQERRILFLLEKYYYGGQNMLISKTTHKTQSYSIYLLILTYW